MAISDVFGMHDNYVHIDYMYFCLQLIHRTYQRVMKSVDLLTYM